ncbi:putative transporter [Lachnellula suecica]|uniref:Putative transporter n=1 Tax=Lachnellula suecica TaxID=602035 RepID=A0A8T9C1S4_9HELO|nr:putative transporter [Lachnellula suecica]
MSRHSSSTSHTQVPEQTEQAWHSPTPPSDEERALPSKEEGKAKDPNQVEWDGDNDQENPRNWSNGYKSWITFQLGMLALAASLGSSIISPANDTIADYVGVSEEVSILSISLYILGFAFGPLCWAPVSELWGRRISMLPAMFCLGLFSIGTATSKNAQSVFITRFFGGIFGSAPVSNVSAALGDIWSPKARGTAITFYAVAVVGGPTLGPLIGSALLVNPYLGWRWTEYIEAIWTFAVLALTLFCLPEVYGPVILKRKAKRLRKETGNAALWGGNERVKLTPKTIVTKHLSRPLRMLVTEPMVTCIALYASFVYALLYLTLEVFPIVFEEHRGWGPVVGSTPFLALFVGVLCAVIINLANQPRYARISDAAHGKPVPEARLAPMAIGGFLFAIGLFWFGWTAKSSILWVSPVFAAGFIGAGFNVIFQQCINFLVDTYGLYAASAVSANTFLRSVLAAGFPLVARPMFNNLGVGPAMSILGGIATIAIPVPFIFMKYGLTLRRMSKFAPVDE